MVRVVQIVLIGNGLVGKIYQQVFGYYLGLGNLIVVVANVFLECSIGVFVDVVIVISVVDIQGVEVVKKILVDADKIGVGVIIIFGIVI